MKKRPKYTIAEAGRTTDKGRADILKPVEPLTQRQFECLTYIYKYFMAHRYYPTQKEITEALKIKSNVAVVFTNPLQRKGYLYVEPGRRRNIRLTTQALKLLEERGVIKEPSQMTFLNGWA